MSMSLNLTLSLRLLPSGQTIEDLTVDSSPGSTLSQFVEECLIGLEVSGDSRDIAVLCCFLLMRGRWADMVCAARFRSAIAV